MRNRNTVEFLGVWESSHNPEFNRVQFEAVKSEAGLNRFVMTPSKWIEQMNAIGMTTKAGRKGNIRDYATIQQLLVLANLESYNAVLIGHGKTQGERLRLLRELAIQQLDTLSRLSMDSLPRIEEN